MKRLLCTISICLAGGLLLSSCALPRTSNKEATGYVFAMDTYMELTAYGQNGQAAIDDSIAEINRLDSLFSVGNPESEIYKLNTTGQATLSEESMTLLNESIKLWNDTDHCFDVAIYPVMDLWGFSSGSYQVPDETELAETLSLANPEYITVENNQVSFKKNEMAIDFGGIAKGYASNRVMEIFKQNGCVSGIVSLGHNVQTLGTKPNGEKWKVAILAPDSEDYLGVVAVADKAVITSGGYERFFEENGRKYHHIIDPSTGYPAESGMSSVTIISEDGTMADALSTSIFIMGFEKGCDYWRSHSDSFDMVLCTEDNKVYITSGIESDFKSDLDFNVIGGK